MKVPNKIYLTEGDSIFEMSLERKDKHDIEYTRTDTFIDKACEYLSYHLDTSKIDVNYKFEFIEKFKNYMKGE